MTEPLLGIDIGTRSVRAGLYLLDGTRLAEAEQAIDTWHSKPGWAEQSPRQVLEAVFSVMSRLREVGPAPAAIALASTAVTAIPVGPDGQPLGDSILWMDTRAAIEATELNRFGHPIFANTGGAVSAEWMLAKVLWIKRHDPDRYAGAERIVDVHDWILFELTGRWSLAKATISAEWSYDPVADAWPTDLLAHFELSDVISGWTLPILDPGSVAGFLTPSAAARSGLAAGTVVAEGLMDSYAAALACDIFFPGRTVLSIGTSSSYLALTTSSQTHPELLGPVPDAFGPATRVQQGGQTSAAALVDWFSRELAPGEPLSGMDKLAGAVPPGCDGLWATDTWQGSRTPYRNPDARGAWGGLSLAHTRAHMFRATLEAVAFGGRLVLDTMSAAGIATENLAVVGGATKSELWMQIHADVVGRELTEAGQGMPVALGAAVCAAIAVGAYSNLGDAARAMHRPGRTWSPNAANQPAYQALYEAYVARVSAS